MVQATLTALADDTRRSVVDLLRHEPRRASDLAAELSITPQAMSRHLRVLRKSGVIREEGIEEDARVRMYQLCPEPFRELRGWLDEVESYWVTELDAFREHVEKRRGKRG
ncbi:MAG TPA: metalloregulator ArsR/SmtB family transcription factor [Bryobacteraceae bacterium]|nr:metalloregulator ArsR/SmtB family transcription factor [Bryobacteraceae bacterium]